MIEARRVEFVDLATTSSSVGAKPETTAAGRGGMIPCVSTLSVIHSGQYLAAFNLY